MITAWVLYRDHQLDTLKFEERDGAAYTAIDPGSWGLNPGRHEIILVLQKASFMQGWVKGEMVK